MSPPGSSVPRFLAHLPVINGLPFPVHGEIGFDGQHNFAATDILTLELLARMWRCSICGTSLTTDAMIGGFVELSDDDSSNIQKLPAERGGARLLQLEAPLVIKEGAMHLACAMYSASVCPHLSTPGRVWTHDSIVAPDRVGVPRGPIWLFAIRTDQGPDSYHIVDGIPKYPAFSGAVQALPVDSLTPQVPHGHLQTPDPITRWLIGRDAQATTAVYAEVLKRAGPTRDPATWNRATEEAIATYKQP